MSLSLRLDRSMLGGTVGPLMVRGSIAVLQFSSLLYLAKFIAPSVFAEAAFMPIAARLGALIALRGGGAVVLAAASLNPGDASGVLRREFNRSWPPALIAGVVLALLFSLTFSKTGPETVVLLIWWPAVVLMTGSWFMVAEYLKGTLRATAGVLLEFAPLTLAFGALAALGWQGQQLGVRSVEAAFVFSQVIALLAAALVMAKVAPAATEDRPGLTSTPQPSRATLTISTVLTLGMPLVVISLVSMLGSPTEAGRLAAVIRLLSPTTIVVSAAAASFVPRILIDQKRRHEPTRPLDGSIVRWSVAMVAALTVPYSTLLLVQPQILELLLGDQYTGLHVTLRVVAVGQIFRGLAGVAVELGQVSGHAATDVKAFGIGAVLAALAWPVLSTGWSVTVAGAFLFASLVATRSVKMFVVAYLRSPKVVAVAS